MRISVIGLGLIGGSIGLGIRLADPTVTVTGYARRPETAQEAIRRGAIDVALPDPGAAVKEADAVIVATPVLSVRDIFAAIAPHLKPGCIVSDVASTKVKVMEWAGELLPPEVYFIGGHPMAGKETSGIEVAEARLLYNKLYCLTPSARASKQAIETMVTVVRKLQAVPYFIDPSEHDELVAGISHLPFLLSVALVSATSSDPRWDKLALLAASGYRDVTRLAAGSSRLYADICLTNRDPILRWLDEYGDELKKLRELVARGDESLEKALAAAAGARERWWKSRQP